MLWHLTHANNLALIRESRILMSAERLAPGIQAEPRRSREIVPGKPVLRDQKPISEKCIDFEARYSLGDFLRDLARRVFFWPGGLDRPIRPGRKAFAAYAASDIIIRVPFLDIVESHTPYFSRCNSGATRMQYGKPVPRGQGTYLQAIQCNFPPSKVVEVNVHPFGGAASNGRGGEKSRWAMGAFVGPLTADPKADSEGSLRKGSG
jgi:hypothetical protein